uniref:Gamma-aminobutyric acid type B receptor subunit 2 n=1 Tax=Strigamia maritima TaxID=126957 RepID=T1JBF7_STRMM
MKAFFDMVYKLPHKLLLFGAACTEVTDPVAKTSRYWHLSQLSYADTHPMFSWVKYPNFYRVVPSEIDFNPPRVELLKKFNWTTVGTLYQNDPRYALAHNKLLSDLDDLVINIIETQSVSEELSSQMTKLKNKDVRIILGNFNETWARRIFCEAYRQGIYGRRYQWLIVTMYKANWWEIQEPDVPCTPDQMIHALEGYIATDLLPLRTDNVTTVSGMTATQYKRHYDISRKRNYSRFHGYAYDGIWTTALAIEAVMDKLKNRAKERSIDRFEYRDAFWGKIFLEALNETNFEGVTGPVRFFNNDRRGFIQIKQFQGGREVKIGEYNSISRELDLTKGKSISWRGSGPPLDHTLIKYEQTRVNLTIYSILAATASLGIISASVFLVINIKFRNQRFIKMSSPYLNNLIIIGCILTYTSVILLGLDSQLTSVDAFPFICTMRAWALMAGFSLAFGSMFSKTWRVHAIFTNIKLNKKVIRDYKLFIIVGILLSMDIAIMTTWQTIDPFYRETKNLQAEASNTDEDLYLVPVMEYCKSDRMTIFLGCIYAYKGLLMVFGCFLAWETRRVSIPALNDSKYIGMSVYNVVIMCVIGAAISFILSDQQNASFIIISVFIIFCTTTTLCLVFVPKLIELKRNPHGTDKRVRATFKPSLKRRRDSEESDIQESMKVLQEENQKCRKTLRENDLELQSLLKQLGEDIQGIFNRDRSKAPKRVELLKREVAFQDVEDEDMNSIYSTSSQDGEHHIDPSTVEDKKRPSFSGAVETSNKNLNDNKGVEEPLTSPSPQREAYQLVYVSSQAPTPPHYTPPPYSPPSEERCSPLPKCSVYTIESPSQQLRRAFSWGKKGYLPLEKRDHTDKTEVVHHQAANTGSLPDITHSPSWMSATDVRNKEQSFAASHQQQQPPPTNHVDRTYEHSSYPTLKCDIVEYL